MSNWNTIKRDKADDLFSKYIRLRDKNCQRCGKQGTGLLGVTDLDASHFHGRGKESTRFDLKNVDAMCRACHKWLGEHKTEYEAWKLKQLGQREYDLLMLRANTPGKKDRSMQVIIWKKLLKDDFGI